jgi:hypothetical protein
VIWIIARLKANGWDIGERCWEQNGFPFQMKFSGRRHGYSCPERLGESEFVSLLFGALIWHCSFSRWPICPTYSISEALRVRILRPESELHLPWNLQKCCEGLHTDVSCRKENSIQYNHRPRHMRIQPVYNPRNMRSLPTELVLIQEAQV